MKEFFRHIRIYLPNFLKGYLEKIILERKLDQHKDRKERHKIKIDEIDKILNKFNFSSDIIIHSSTSNIGKIEGGTSILTDLILSKIDLNTYTLMSPALPFTGSVKNYLDDLTVFDLDIAKNAMGNISNQIMKKSDCRRSFHPTHSVIAIGRNSEYYSENHEICETPFSENSPFYKLTINNGKILMFGVGLNFITNFHVYEDLLGDFFPLDVYTADVYTIKGIKKGNINSIKTKAHNPHISAKRDCERAREFLIKNKYIESYMIGDSEISLLDAKGLTITLLNMLKHGDSIYGKVKIDNALVFRIDEILKELE